MDPEEFQFYTSLSPDAFDILYELLGGEKELAGIKYRFDRKTPMKQIEYEHTNKGKLFITLVRLRRGLPLRDLKRCFHLSESTLSAIFYTWVRIMAIQFKRMEKAIFPSVRNQSKNPPDCYKPFSNLRCVVDCTEFKVQHSDNMEQENNTHSEYKGACTHKVQVATSVYGGLCHISEAAEGNISDRKLLMVSGPLDYVKAEEAIMTDKGFDVESILNRHGIELLIPQFLGQRDQFTAREVLQNKAISTARVHVERFIKMMRDFRIIRHQVPNTMADILPDIIRVCANLVMFSDPFIRWHHPDESLEEGVQK